MVLQLKPADTGGTLDASIQWGEEEGPDPMLVHGITIPLGPVRLGGQADDEPVLRLHSIRFDVRSWRELAGRSFTFPNVVREIEAEGETHPVYDVYGSLRLGNDYHRVVVSDIAFGRYDGARVTATVDGRVESVSPSPEFDPTDFTCEARLSVGPVTVRGDLASTTPPSAAEAPRLAGQLLRLEDYRPPQERKGAAVLEPAG